jgi:hypothetical protein
VPASSTWEARRDTSRALREALRDLPRAPRLVHDVGTIDASSLFAIGGLLVAAGSALVSWLAFRRSDQALKLAEAADKRDDERLKRERSEHAERQSADVIVTPAGFSGDSSGRHYGFTVRNVGNAIARSVKVWIVNAENVPVGGPAPSDPAGLTLREGEDAGAKLGVTVPNGSMAGLSYRLSWTDGAGPHEVDGPSVS